MYIYLLIILLIFLIIYRKYFNKSIKIQTNDHPIIIFQISGANVDAKSLYIYDDGAYEITSKHKVIKKDKLSDEDLKLMKNLVNNPEITIKKEIYTGTDMVYKVLIINGFKINLDDGSPYHNSNYDIPGIKLGLKMLGIIV